MVAMFVEEGKKKTRSNRRRKGSGAVRDGREERMGESWLPYALIQLIITAGFQYFVMSGSCFKSLPSKVHVKEQDAHETKPAAPWGRPNPSQTRLQFPVLW